MPAPEERVAGAEQLAAQRGWQASVVAAGQFSLMAYLPRTINPSPTLTVYIEGDGLAWIGGSRPSDDPTPANPLALRLALAQPAGNAAYLARPCQYAGRRDSACTDSYWTDRRFSREVVESTSIAIDALMLRFGADRLTLVGYSGGGAIAALVAAQRPDVVLLITVAGNLDHDNWTKHHNVLPLIGIGESRKPDRCPAATFRSGTMLAVKTGSSRPSWCSSLRRAFHRGNGPR